MNPQVPAEQRSQRLWCVECFRLEHIDLDEVAEELGWQESVCPDCCSRARIDAANVERFGTTTPSEQWNPTPRWAEVTAP